MRRIALACLWLCAALAGQTLAQSPAAVTESSAVSALLSSKEPAKLAWGAHLVGNCRLTGFEGDLLRLATHADWRVRMAATDTLIRLNINVPETVLTAMADNRLDEVLIVIARRPGQYNHLIERLSSRKLEDHDWVALNSILTSRPTAGFAAELLQAWTIRLTVQVTAPGFAVGEGSSGGGGVECGASFAQPGFPPLEAYYVVENPQPGDVLLANGPHPIGYRRQSGHTRSLTLADRDSYRRDYLTHLAQISTSEPDGVTLHTTTMNIAWTTEAQFRIEAREISRKIARSLNHLKKRLVERKLLSLVDANRINPSLEVRVLDQRGIQIPPLPAVNWVLAAGTQREY
ncbi:MAG: hypothetical protein JNL98_24155 [Bryobacterales bacterium]|nr:hypothetical protein [Bryobacterales bacterium]